MILLKSPSCCGSVTLETTSSPSCSRSPGRSLSPPKTSAPISSTSLWSCALTTPVQTTAPTGERHLVFRGNLYLYSCVCGIQNSFPKIHRRNFRNVRKWSEKMQLFKVSLRKPNPQWLEGLWGHQLSVAQAPRSCQNCLGWRYTLTPHESVWNNNTPQPPLITEWRALFTAHSFTTDTCSIWCLKMPIFRRRSPSSAVGRSIVFVSPHKPTVWRFPPWNGCFHPCLSTCAFLIIYRGTTPVHINNEEKGNIKWIILTIIDSCCFSYFMTWTFNELTLINNETYRPTGTCRPPHRVTEFLLVLQ